MTEPENGTAVDVLYENHRWSITAHDVQLEATGPRLEHVSVRCRRRASRSTTRSDRPLGTAAPRP